MKNIPFSYLLWIFCLLFSGSLVYAKDFVQKKTIIENLFLLNTENNPSLSISKTDITIDKQAHKLATNMQLPSINFSCNGTILDKYFSNTAKVELPFLGNTFSIGTTQLIWKKNTVGTTIQVKPLQEDLSLIGYLPDEQNIALLTLEYNLDLFKL